ncbi:MAG: threonine--tRNA ligase [Elusimicrobia bacterium]|nr:threonine--tRNA ligase [Elusimicrobiota bacterium]
MKEQLERLRHSCAHIMAQAVVELFPGTRLAIGPPIEDGFYYDFDTPHRFTPEDFSRIEDRMRQIVAGRHPFVRTERPNEEARRWFSERGETYKLELLDAIPDLTVSFYQQDSFLDLCEGPHVTNTGEVKHFKLLKIAGAYWRGDEHRQQLQRIYGTAWPTKEDLEAYLKRLEEAKQRDHRELGPRLELFTILPEEAGPGLVFWLPKGAMVRKVIEDVWKELHLKAGYQLTYLPHISKIDLWKTSGHWEYYQENMYAPIDIEGQQYILKPMNCPGHLLIYKTQLRSYRDLPIRFAELGTVYRYERSGVLHGLLRVRGFTQDDAHIFCRPEQLASEVVGVLRLMQMLLGAFGFNEYEVRLSTRPEKAAGSLERWTEAEHALQEALKRANLPFEIDPGEGVFYGPKVDIKIRDSLGRFWQCSTVQVDFNLPERFHATFRDAQGGDRPVIMVHRALMGSLERFLGILIEQYGGAFPTWLAPIQAIVLPITDTHLPYAEEVAQRLAQEGFRYDIDRRNETMNLKIREAALQKIPYLLIVGDKEAKARTVSIRKRTGEQLGPISLEECVSLIQQEVQTQRGWFHQ